MAVYVGPLARQAIGVMVHATRADDGADVFAARTTSIHVSAADSCVAIDVPDDVRRSCEEYRAAMPAVPGILLQVAR